MEIHVHVFMHSQHTSYIVHMYSPPDRLSHIHVVASKLVDDSMLPQGDQLTREGGRGSEGRLIQQVSLMHSIIKLPVFTRSNCLLVSICEDGLTYPVISLQAP